MKSRRRIMVAALVVVSAASIGFFLARGHAPRRASPQRDAVGEERPVPSAVPEHVLAGVVVSWGETTPVAGATVRLFEGGPGATTDEGGRFRIAHDLDQPIALLAAAEGFRPEWMQPGANSEVQIELRPGDACPYWVEDPDGSPVEAAQVTLGLRLSFRKTVVRRRLETDPAGFFEANPGRGEALVLRAAGYHAVEYRAPPRTRDRATQTLVLRPARALMGRVVDTAGEPIARATVSYRRYGDYRKRWNEAPQLSTDAAGRFRVDAALHRYDVRVTCDGYGEGYVHAFPDNPDLTIVLRSPATLKGHVLTPDGHRAASAELSLWDSGLFATANADGNFTLTGLRPGYVRIHGYWSGIIRTPRGPFDTWCRWNWNLRLEDGEMRSGVELRLQGARYSWLPLRILDEQGKPLIGARITDTGTLDVLDPEGQEIPIPPDGSLLLRAQDEPGYCTFLEIAARGFEWQRSIVMREPGTKDVLELRLPKPQRIALVLFDETGRPIPDDAMPEATVDCWNSARARPAGRRGNRFEFLVEIADDIAMSYCAWAKGFATVDVRNWVPSRNQAPIEIRMPPEARVRGEVAEGLRVSCAGNSVVSDGSFALGELTPGETVLRIADAQTKVPLLRRRVRLEPGMNDMGRLRLPPPRTIRGLVVDAAGRPCGGARVQVLEPGHASTVETVTRPNGTFHFRLRDVRHLRLVARRHGLASGLVQVGTKRITMRARAQVRYRIADPTQWERLRLVSDEGHRLALNGPHYDYDYEADAPLLTDLPSGKWSLEIIGPFDAVYRSIPLVLVPGRTLELNE